MPRKYTKQTPLTPITVTSPMKPMMILPDDLMTQEQAGILRANGICVVTCKDPARVKFVDPLPVVTSRNEVENAAIRLCRMLMNWQWPNGVTFGDQTSIGKNTVAKMYVDLLLQGSSLDANGTKEEQEHKLYEKEKREELWRIAREDARAERAAAKAKSKKSQPTATPNMKEEQV